MSYNTYGNGSKVYGGAYPVWFHVDGIQTSGGTLETLPPVGTVIPAGTMVQMEVAGDEHVKILETFTVAANVSTTDTEVKVIAAGKLPVLEATMAVMKAPATATGTGKAVLVGKVTDNGDGTHSFTITAGALGALTKGDILVRAAAEGASAKMYCVPTGLTFNDVYIEEGTTKATCASVEVGKIMEDRIAPVPDCVKAVLPRISFQKGV